MANFPSWLVISLSTVCWQSFATVVLPRPLGLTTNASLGVCKQNGSMVFDSEFVEATLFMVAIFAASHELTLIKKIAVCSVASDNHTGQKN